MARRFKPPELRGTLGTLVRTTIHQAGVVKDALLERAAASAGRVGGRREEALAELGEVVLELIRAGEIDPEELPEVRAIVAELDELDADAEASARPRSLRRRGRGERGERDVHDARDARDDEGADIDHDAARRFDEERAALPRSRSRFDERDGTVSSGASGAPKAPAGGRRSPTETRVWRPVVAAPPVSVAAAAPAAPVEAPAARSGGISFDDEDLADYMHPDDVPARDGSKEESKDPPETD